MGKQLYSNCITVYPLTLEYGWEFGFGYNGWETLTLITVLDGIILVGGLDGTITIMVMDLVGLSTVLDTGFWLWWIWLEQCFYSLTIIMVVRIYETTPTMQVEEVQSTPMITQIEILALETTTTMKFR
jgi:hypothetical protein